MGKKWIVILTTAGLSFYLAGCSTTATSHDVTLTGTAEGMRAFGDTIIGIQKTMVEPKNESKYFANRQLQEDEISKRHAKLSFWQRLAGAMNDNSTGGK